MLEFQRGEIESYDDRAGYGFIRPDDPSEEGQKLLVHRKSLRSPNLQLEQGDRVLYQTEIVPRGILAIDVHPENSEAAEEIGSPTYFDGHGIIESISLDRGYGHINGENKLRIFFRFANLAFDPVEFGAGTSVTFQYKNTSRGPEARLVTLSVNTSSANFKNIGAQGGRQQDLLASAIISRDSKDFENAVKLYKRGLEEQPSVQLVTSYAAMEKNRNRRKEAMLVYERGLELFPGNLKLCEDAGFLAGAMNNHRKALDFLEKGLSLAGGVERTERTFLLSIARLYVARPTAEEQQKGLDYYHRAKRAFDSSRYGKGTFPKEDLLAMGVAAIKLQHYRGNLIVEFIKRIGFKIVRAQLLEQATTGADIVVEVKNPELIESYGISGNLLIRCIFKSTLTLADITGLEKVTADWGATGLIDDQVSLLMVGSLPEQVEKLLYRRVEDKRRATPAIVPLTQSLIETADNPLSALRFVLDQWLHRRDLFAQNFPVSGRRFFGRHRPLAELREAIASGTSAGIFGLRKVGKTSLLKEVERRSSESGDIVIYVDLLRVPADITDTRWIYWKLASELNLRLIRSGIKSITWRLGGKFADYLDVPPDFPVATAFDSDLSQTLNAIRGTAITPRPRVVLMLDEIERILPNELGKEGFGGFFDFFSYLRGVAQESDDFVVIVTGANAAIAEASQFSGKDNPVFNFFKEIYVPLLQPPETGQMLRTLGRGMGMYFAPEAFEQVHALTGGHPFFARQFCSFLSDRYSDRPLTVDLTMIDAIVGPYLAVAGKDFQEIVDRFSRDYPHELNACLAVAAAGGTLEIAELNAKIEGDLNLNHLLGYQLIALDGLSVTLTMGLMRQWLSRLIPKAV